MGLPGQFGLHHIVVPAHCTGLNYLKLFYGRPSAAVPKRFALKCDAELFSPHVVGLLSLPSGIALVVLRDEEGMGLT